jgi:hypothetical protein
MAMNTTPSVREIVKLRIREVLQSQSPKPCRYQMKRVPNEWKRLTYLDPEAVLARYREIELSSHIESLGYSVKSLRTNSLKICREARQAALLCYGMSKVLGAKVWFAQFENRDFDIVARYQIGEEQHFVPVQLKELVPATLQPSATLQREIDKLNKYVAGQDLAVAFHINREMTLRVEELKLPLGKLGELWLFGASGATQSDWFLLGDLLSSAPSLHKFTYPTP